MFFIVKLLLNLMLFYFSYGHDLPLVINTWGFTDANKIAWKVLNKGGSVIDAVEAGCTECEELQCDGTVGFGGSPDETGETTLDAMIMDGKTMNAGAVGSLRNTKSAVSVARYIMEHTTHTLLVGSQASRFAFKMGFPKESLSTNVSERIWYQWRANKCQPNYWINVTPDPTTSCGPYKPIKYKSIESELKSTEKSYINHDTIGMIAIDVMGNVAVATSTNGARHKIPGRVGDSPIIGSGGYANNEAGGAAATGDGDILMRFLPSFKAVEDLKSGKSPQEAATNAIQNIMKHYSNFKGAVVVADKYGNFSAACYGIDEFPFSVSFRNQPTTILKVKCL